MKHYFKWSTHIIIGILVIIVILLLWKTTENHRETKRDIAPDSAFPRASR